jgi:hypothetical protein
MSTIQSKQIDEMLQACDALLRWTQALKSQLPESSRLDPTGIEKRARRALEALQASSNETRYFRR